MKKKEINEYYTYAQIVNSLRKYYQESQGLLNQMKDCIDVDSKEDNVVDLRLELEQEKLDYNLAPGLYLTVSKDLSTNPATYIRNTMNQMIFSDYRYKKDHATYTLGKKDSKYQFTPYNSVVLGEYYSPEINIPDEKQEQFTRAYKDLRESAIYSLPELIVKINPFQDLYIRGDSILLSNQGETGKGIDITYTAKDDKIHVKSEVKYSTAFVEELLETRIPKYEFPDKYFYALEGNRKPEEVYIDDVLNRRQEVLSLEDRPKVLMLTRDI